MPATSSECVSVNRRASAASLRAYASSPTAVAWNRPVPATTIAPDSTSSPRRFSDRLGLPGQQRLVELEPVRGVHPAVGGHLVAGPQLEQVVEHDLLDRDLGHRTVAHDAAPSARSAPRAGRACASPGTPGRCRSSALTDEDDAEQPVRR